ncbi:MAG: hypothetical protein ER33_07600 [Cyanobium sp. CACIAM 14]|nr:MAG: hypothetical protein ER33_07600 [Cyanobium sp. CACIAM 14]
MTQKTSTNGTDAQTSASGPGGVSWIAWLYLVLALCGAVLPWLANLDFIQASGSAFDLGLFFQMANANPAARSLSSDLAVGATAVTIWMVRESRRLRMRGLPWVLLSCVTIAFAFGAPLFLHLRERRLQELARANGGTFPATL